MSLSQAFPPKATFTESSLPDLKDKVYVVTGASAGVGKELARILFSRNATVYIAARDSTKASAAISWMREQHAYSRGRLEFLHLDLADLSGVQASALEFISKERRLDVLFNNAGVMIPPQGSVTKQGWELQMGTNCLAPFLFTKMLTPLMIETAKMEGADVRVVWVSSDAAMNAAPKGGVDMKNVNYEKDKKPWIKYATSKAGNVLHAIEYARRYGADGITSISLTPGYLRSDLQRNFNPLARGLMHLIMSPPVNGAYTELFAGFSSEAKQLKAGEWIIPFGRVGKIRKDIGEGDVKREFWEWCERVVGEFVV